MNKQNKHRTQTTQMNKQQTHNTDYTDEQAKQNTTEKTGYELLHNSADNALNIRLHGYDAFIVKNIKTFIAFSCLKNLHYFQECIPTGG